MSTVGDTTDSQGTRRPKENPLADEYDTFKPLNIPDCAPQVNFPLNILLRHLLFISQQCNPQCYCAKYQ